MNPLHHRALSHGAAALLLGAALGFAALQGRVPETAPAQTSPAAMQEPPEPAHRDYRQLAEELAQAKARWAERGNESYRITVSTSCFCGITDSPVRADVRSGRLVRAWQKTESGRWALMRPVPVLGTLTVKGLFATIERAISFDAEHLAVAFDTELGFPRRIDIDHMRMTTDDELSVDVQEVRLEAQR